MTPIDTLLNARKALKESEQAELHALIVENQALRADAERYRWLKECTIEQFDYLSNNWCGLDNEIDVMMKIERSGDYYARPAAARHRPGRDPRVRRVLLGDAERTGRRR